FGFDVFYIAARHYVAKIRVGLCPCQPQPPARLALLPDEAQAVRAVVSRIAGGISTGEVAPPGLSTPVALADPCQLLSASQVDSVIGASRPPARITLGDEAEECTWNGISGNESVVIQTGDSMDQFQTRVRETPQPMSGLGDQANVDPEF